MDWQIVVNTASASAVISALVSGFVARRNSERAIQIENITKERAKWRDKIREHATVVHRVATERNYAKLSELRLSLSLNLNPTDKEDRAILNAISGLQESKPLDADVPREFWDRLALCLKHDWDRAKREAKPIPFRWWYTHRTTYEEFTADRY